MKRRNCIMCALTEKRISLKSEVKER
ncbi:MAG: hypothetical protein BROFUL_00193, partial [Candidatus Brocadia fulgida]